MSLFYAKELQWFHRKETGKLDMEIHAMGQVYNSFEVYILTIQHG